MNCEHCPHPEHSGRVCGVDATDAVADFLRASPLWRELEEAIRTSPEAEAQAGGPIATLRLTRVQVACACGQDD